MEAHQPLQAQGMRPRRGRLKPNTDNLTRVAYMLNVIMNATKDITREAEVSYSYSGCEGTNNDIVV
jgi:hypothetical protein